MGRMLIVGKFVKIAQCLTHAQQAVCPIHVHSVNETTFRK